MAEPTLATEGVEFSSPATHPISQQEQQIITLISTSFNLVSILACSFLIVGYYYLKELTPMLLNRLSLRLIVATAACTIAYSFVQLLSSALEGDSFVCSFSVYAYLYFVLVSAFLITAVTFNLQLVFLRRKQDSLAREHKYYRICFLAPFLIATPAYVADMYGWSEASGTCWLRDQRQTANKWWVFFSYHLWIWLVVAYNLVMVVRIFAKLRRNRKLVQMRALPQNGAPTSKKSSKRKLKLKAFAEVVRMVVSVVEYPMVLIVTQVPSVVAETIHLWFDATPPKWLLFVGYTTIAMQGILMGAVFWHDQTVRKSVRTVKQQVVFDYLDREQRATVMEELGIDMEKGQARPTRWRRLKDKLIGVLLVSEQDRADLYNAEQVDREKKVLKSALPAEPAPAMVADKGRTYDLHADVQEVDEADMHPTVDWDSAKLGL